MKAPRTRLRAPWLRPPCSAAAKTPCSRSCSATRSAPSLVRTKTTVRPSRLATSAVIDFLCMRVDQHDVVRHRRDAGRGRVRRVGHGVLEVALDQLVDAPVQGRREQQPLAALRDPVEDRRDLGQEAHLGHVVGLVEDRDGAVAQVDRAALDQVVEAARGGDEQVDAAVQRAELRLVRHAAGDELVAQAQHVHQRLEGVADLHRELAGRAHDQGLGLRAAAGVAGGQASQGRQAERERLARAGLTAAEDVLAGHARPGWSRPGSGTAS